MNLISACWPDMEDLNIRKINQIVEQNYIANEGCQYLSESKWPSLKRINLRTVYNR